MRCREITWGAGLVIRKPFARAESHPLRQSPLRRSQTTSGPIPLLLYGGAEQRGRVADHIIRGLILSTPLNEFH